MFFSLSLPVLSPILQDEYLTLAVRTKEGDKAGSNQPSACDPAEFNLELAPNYLISYLENTVILTGRPLLFSPAESIQTLHLIPVEQSKRSKILISDKLNSMVWIL